MDKPTPCSLSPCTLALGILSSAAGAKAAQFARRRATIRSSWLTSPVALRSVTTRFVLRCGGDESLHVRTSTQLENRTNGDLLCADVPASDGRKRGPVRALWWWMRYAHHAFAGARFLGKADDDVYIHLADAEALLLDIERSNAGLAYVGAFHYVQLHLERRGNRTTK